MTAPEPASPGPKAQERGLLRRVWVLTMGIAEVSDRCQLGLMAAGVAFFGFLAVFPAAAAAIAILGFVYNPALVSTQMVVLDDFLPPAAYHLLEDQVHALVNANSSTIGWTTVLSITFALWSARAGIGALIQGLNAVHGHPQRVFLEHTLQAVVMTLFLILIALAVVVAGFVVPVLLKVLPIGETSARTLAMINTAVGLSVVTLGTSLIYRYGPNHAKTRPPLVTPGLVLAVVLWVAASRGLMVYLANFGSYNQIYGSIGAVVALMMWFYLGAYAVLLGAALDAVRATRLQ
jgi:membrane protein